MRFNWKLVVAFVAIGGLVLLSAYVLLPMFMMNPVGSVHTESSSNYWVTVNLTTPNSPMYTSVGQNMTVFYEALWSYGDKTGHPIENATVTIQVKSTTTNKTVSTLYVNTTSGFFSFNYTTSVADILSFNTTKVITQEGKEFNVDTFDPEAGSWELRPKSATVWYDTFRVELVDFDTTNLGVTAVSVNVTYQLLPEEGLTLPAWATCSGQTFLPKIVHGQNVTINGVQAQETTMSGIYTAEVSNWFPTAYIHIAASQQNWTATHTGFSFSHEANLSIWAYTVTIVGVALIGTVMFKMVTLRKSINGGLSKQSNLSFFAGALLAVASTISLYWAAVGTEGTIAGFDWIMLAGLGVVACGIGFAGAIMAFRRRKQAFVICSIILPLVVNLVVVKAELDVYQLATPWMTLFGAFAIAVVSGILITNSEKAASLKKE